MSDIDTRLVSMLDSIPYARFLGIRAELAGDGNPMLPAIHGGVLGAFMEMTALAQLSVAAPMKRQPRTIDVSIEYLRSGRPLTTYARASIKKLGRRIANVHVEAWQETRSAPIATMRGLFLVAPSED
jgi:acyl-coenzyme A thioesterase PaaI-like protein